MFVVNACGILFLRSKNHFESPARLSGFIALFLVLFLVPQKHRFLFIIYPISQIKQKIFMSYFRNRHNPVTGKFTSPLVMLFKHFLFKHFTTSL